jgi:hypothetical protein
MRIYSGTHSEVQKEDSNDRKQLAQQEHVNNTIGLGVMFLESS